MNPLLNTPEKIWLNCINISVQTNWADPAWIQKEYGAVVHPDVTFAGKENGEIGCLITNKPGSGVEGGNPDDPNSLGDAVPLEGDVLGVELACQKTLESGVKGSGRNRPQTGDDTPVAGYAMMAVFCGGIFVFYIRKRKKDHKKA